MSSVYSNQRPNPCNGCPDRYIACSDHCDKPEHLEWKAEQEKIRENRKKLPGAGMGTAGKFEKNA